MAKETKVGMLVGMGIILLIAWVVGDHLSVVSQQAAPDLTSFADRSGQNLINQVAPDPLYQQQPLQPGAGAPVGGAPANPLGGQPVDAQPADQPPADSGPVGGEPVDAEPQDDQIGGPSIPTADEAERRLDQPPAGNPADGAIGQGLEARRIGDVAGNQYNPGGQQPGQNAGQRRDALREDLPGQPRLGPRPQRVYHDVQEGETLWAIANQHGQNGSRWKLIQDANPTAVGANGRIRPGVRLIIPPELFIDPAEAREAQQGNLPPDDAVAELQRNLNDNNRQAQQLPENMVRAKKGDTLGHLAMRHLGSSRQWPKLLEANRDKLSRPEDLREGMVLRLPPGARQAQAAGDTTQRQPLRVEAREQPAPRQPQPRRPGTWRGGKTYRVKAGQTLRSIAAEVFGSKDRWKDLYRANADQIDDPDRVEAGLTLVIP